MRVIDVTIEVFLTRPCMRIWRAIVSRSPLLRDLERRGLLEMFPAREEVYS